MIRTRHDGSLPVPLLARTDSASQFKEAQIAEKAEVSIRDPAREYNLHDCVNSFWESLLAAGIPLQISETDSRSLAYSDYKRATGK